MPQTLPLSDTHRPSGRDCESSALRNVAYATLPKVSIFRQLAARLFTDKAEKRGPFSGQEMLASSDLFPFFMERGIALYHLGHYQKALADFRAALQLNWRDEDAASWVARAEQAGRNRPGSSFQVFVSAV